MPFRVSLNTPLVPHLVEFSKCVEPLRLHRATAQILDDIRFLVSLVLALPEDSSEKDLQKVQSTSAWIHSQILGLPNETPAMEHQHTNEPYLSVPTEANYRQESHSTASRTASGQHSPSYSFRSQGSGSSAPVVDHFSPSTPPGQSEATSKDLMYQAVRRTALIYARAIMSRKGLSDPAICSGEDLLSVWVTVLRIPLKVWKGCLGIFVWIMLSIAPASRDTKYARCVKSLLTVGLVQMNLDDWDVSERGMRGGLKLVTWLSGDAGVIECSTGVGSSRSTAVA